MLFISRDACNYSIANFLVLVPVRVSHNCRRICCTMGYRTDVPL